MTTKKVTLTRDIGLSYSVIMKLICSCGWYDKFYERDALGKAEAHLRKEHDGGLIHYSGIEIEVE